MQTTLAYELEQSRRYAGISLTEWQQMPGSHMWLLPGQTLCKADVLVAYRLSNEVEAVQTEIVQRDIEAQDRKNRLRR